GHVGDQAAAQIGGAAPSSFWRSVTQSARARRPRRSLSPWLTIARFGWARACDRQDHRRLAARCRWRRPIGKLSRSAAGVPRREHEGGTRFLTLSTWGLRGGWAALAAVIAEETGAGANDGPVRAARAGGRGHGRRPGSCPERPRWPGRSPP